MEGIGLISAEGHPLLVRTLSGGEFPSTHLLSLFSSDKFAKEHAECNIGLAESESKKVAWKQKSNFTLIGWFHSNVSDHVASRLLLYSEYVLLMFMGQEDLDTIDQTLKRDLRLCYPVLDSLLTTIDDIPPFVIVEFPIKPVNPALDLRSSLDKWAEEIETPYAAIVDGNELLVATADFEDALSHEEVNLVVQVVTLNKTAALVEIPIYMPKSFPNAAHRLIMVRLFDGVTALGVCGVNPPLSKVLSNPPFVALNTQLRNRRTQPRELLHSSLLGFIIRDSSIKKSAFYVHPRKMSVMEDELNKLEISHSLLRTYENSKSATGRPIPQHSEYYAVRKDFKAFVLFEQKRHLVFLFAPEVPIFALKDIAQQTAGQLTNWNKPVQV